MTMKLDYSFWLCVIEHGVRDEVLFNAVARTCRASEAAARRLRDSLVERFFVTREMRTWCFGWQKSITRRACLHGAQFVLVDRDEWKVSKYAYGVHVKTVSVSTRAQFRCVLAGMLSKEDIAWLASQKTKNLNEDDKEKQK